LRFLLVNTTFALNWNLVARKSVCQSKFYFEYKTYIMSLEEKIMQDLKEAMRAKDEAALRGIRAIKSAILLVKTDGSGIAIDEAKEIAILQKLVKQRKESLGIYEAQGREDLAAVERDEIAIIERYLPKQMDAEEITAVLKDIIAEVGATSPKDMGKVMGAATKAFAGKADGKLISEIVKQLLA
jgi:hypothetical protein